MMRDDLNDLAKAVWDLRLELWRAMRPIRRPIEVVLNWLARRMGGKG